MDHLARPFNYILKAVTLAWSGSKESVAYSVGEIAKTTQAGPVHKYVCSIIERRNPWIDAIPAANWTVLEFAPANPALQPGVPKFGYTV